jgi:hypothetical protein
LNIKKKNERGERDEASGKQNAWLCDMETQRNRAVVRCGRDGRLTRPKEAFEEIAGFFDKHLGK